MSFALQYKKLNPAQKQAVDLIDGPVMVVAGPGTGKTHVLTLRIANILNQTDVSPNNILALTFTDSAAKNMRSRLIELIGKNAYSVHIETFHALCDAIITDYPEFFAFELDSLPITQVEQFDLIRSLLDDPKLKHLRTPGSKYHYARDLVSAVSTLKREGVTPEALAKIVEDETSWFQSEREGMKKTELLKWEPLIGRHLELVGIYEKYQKELRLRLRYDFDDMLLEVHKALTNNPILLSALQEQFQYILVDEYQDTNGVQNAIVDTIASFWDEPNLFVVGDPNQTIFRFQGALLENTLGFLDRYPKATLITLGQGYRSNQLVYDAAQKLIQATHEGETHPLSESLSQTLKASHSKGNISLQTTETDSEELLLLTENIKGLLAQNIEPREIAVLYKRNSDGEILADLFARAQIPFHTERDINALEDETLKQFFTLLKLLSSLKTTDEHRLLFDVLGFNWFTPSKTLSPLSILKLIRAFSSQRSINAPFEFISQDEKILKKLVSLKGITTEEWQVLEQLTQLLSSWSAEESKLNFPQFFEQLAKDSGLLDHLISTSPIALQNYIACFKEVVRLTRTKKTFSQSDFLTYLDTMSQHNLSLPVNASNGSQGVALSTVHKAKGKEWEHVFIPFMRQGYWGKTRSKTGLRLPENIVMHGTTSDPEADERRQLFVALTRAKNTAHLSFSKLLTDGDRVSETIPSPYLQEIKDLIAGEEHIKLDTALNSLFILPKATIDLDQQTKEWLSSLLASFTLSYSSLNTYLEDPRVFYERYVLKLPEATQPHLAFGNAIHAALEHYFKLYQEKEQTHLPIESVLPTFERTLMAHQLNPGDEMIRREQGQRVLNAYLENQTNTFPQVIATEESFGWKRGKVILGETQLVGKIDRIDLVEVGNKRLKVIDYKTGRTRTAGEIEGKTKSSGLSTREQQLPEAIRGRMKRQLLFYKLLLSLDPKYRGFEVNEGVFEFVEPEKGKFITRSVSLLSEDVELLKELIQVVDKEIKELKFLSA